MVSHENYGPQLTILSWALVLFSALFLGLRVRLKINHGRGLWWDDYLLIAAWLALVAAVVLNVVDVGHGYGRHTYDVSPQSLPIIVTNGTVSGTLILLGACWSKTSFAFTLLRLPIDWMRYLVWTIIITLNLAMHLSALSIWLECPPGPPGSAAGRVCLPLDVALMFAIVVGSYSAAVDFTLALLPWKFLWNLQMKRREKIGVLIAMSMGAFAGLSAIIKTTKLTTLASPDIIDSVTLAAWGTAEVGVTIMAASIPILRALFRPRANMPNVYAGGTGATPERRRGAAAAEAAAAAAAVPPPSAKDAGVIGLAVSAPLHDAEYYGKDTKRVASIRSNIHGDLGDDDDDDYYEDLKKPVGTTPRSFISPP